MELKTLQPQQEKAISTSTDSSIIIYPIIIVADIVLSIISDKFIEAIVISTVGAIFITLFFFHRTVKKEKNDFSISTLLFLLTAAPLIVITIIYPQTDGIYLYLFPVAIGYLTSSAMPGDKTRFRVIYFLVFSIAVIWVLLHFIHPISIERRSLGTFLYSFRFLSSFLLTALPVSRVLLSKSSKEKLPQTINYHEDVFRSYFEACIIFDKETLEIKDYNDSLAKLFELPVTADFHDLFLPQIMMRHLAGGSPNLELLMNKIPDEWIGEATFLTYTKKSFDASIKSFSFTRNETTYMLLSIRNISDLSKAKKDLVAYKEKLEKASKAKAAFLGNMSHELRTPLNGIIGTCNLILTEKNLPENIKKQISILNYSSEHMLAIINDILDFSKIDAGALELKKYCFNLNATLRELMRSFENVYDNKNINLMFNHDPGLEDVNILSDERKTKTNTCKPPFQCT